MRKMTVYHSMMQGSKADSNEAIRGVSWEQNIRTVIPLCDIAVLFSVNYTYYTCNLKILLLLAEIKNRCYCHTNSVNGNG